MKNRVVNTRLSIASLGIATTVVLAACGGGSGTANDAAANPDASGTDTATATDTGATQDLVPAGNDGPGPTPGDAAVTVDESGKASLSGKDGITGIADGMLFAYNTTTKAELVTDYFTLSAKGTTAGAWEMTIPDHPGTFSCGMNAASSTSAFLSLNLNLTGVPRGTATPALGGGCTVSVKSVAPNIEGSFTATLSGTAAAKHTVTSGYFFFADGLEDCSLASDPGVGAADSAATVSVFATNYGTWRSRFWKCGHNFKFPLVAVSPPSPEGQVNVIFANDQTGSNRRTFTIEGISGAGTFTCGQPGNAMAGAQPVKVSVTGYSGGTCSINVTTFDANVIAGTYEAMNLKTESLSHMSTVSVRGTFRAARTP